MGANRRIQRSLKVVITVLAYAAAFLALTGAQEDALSPPPWYPDSASGSPTEQLAAKQDAHTPPPWQPDGPAAPEIDPADRDRDTQAIGERDTQAPPPWYPDGPQAPDAPPDPGAPETPERNHDGHAPPPWYPDGPLAPIEDEGLTPSTNGGGSPPPPQPSSPRQPTPPALPPPPTRPPPPSRSPPRPIPSPSPSPSPSPPPTPHPEPPSPSPASSPSPHPSTSAPQSPSSTPPPQSTPPSPSSRSPQPPAPSPPSPPPPAPPTPPPPTSSPDVEEPQAPPPWSPVGTPVPAYPDDSGSPPWYPSNPSAPIAPAYPDAFGSPPWYPAGAVSPPDAPVYGGSPDAPQPMADQPWGDWAPPDAPPVYFTTPAYPPSPPVPRAPRLPPSPPTPPSPPPSPPAPPPPRALDMKLVGTPPSLPNWSNSGIVTMYSNVSYNWGAICVESSTFTFQNAEADSSTANLAAKLMCKQMDYPQRAAMLVPQTMFANVSLSGIGAIAAFTDAHNLCPNAFDLDNVAACSGLLIPRDGPSGSCQQLAARLNLTGTYEPAGVVCTDGPLSSPPPPPSPSPPAPAPPPPPVFNLPVRIVDPATGQPITPTSSPSSAPSSSPSSPSASSSGRLEVLFNGTWGSVCAAAHLAKAWAEFACRSMDLPSSGATVAPMPATSPAVAPTTQPTWVVGAFGCTSTSPTEPPGVRCEAVGGPQLTPELFAGGSGSGSGGGGGGGGQARAVPEDVARQLQLLAVECDPRALGHLLDAFVTCAEASPPAPPPSPRPPSPPLRITNSVLLNATELFPYTYAVAFGLRIRELGYAMTWGTVCEQRDEEEGSSGVDTGAHQGPTAGAAAAAVEAISSTTANTLCRQITRGVRPYGFTAPVPVDTPYTFLPSPEVRLVRPPVVLSSLECGDNPTDPNEAAGLASKPTVQFCKVQPALDPLAAISTRCRTSGWPSSLLACTDVPVPVGSEPQLLAARLVLPNATIVTAANGATAAAAAKGPVVGRLEVALRGALQYGWGTACSLGFNDSIAQAACRDLRLPYAHASFTPASQFPGVEADPDQPILLADVVCGQPPAASPQEQSQQGSAGGSSTAAARQLSFVQDCRRRSRVLYSGECSHADDVVLVCAGEDAQGGAPPAQASPPLRSPAASPGAVRRAANLRRQRLR